MLLEHTTHVTRGMEVSDVSYQHCIPLYYIRIGHPFAIKTSTSTFLDELVRSKHKICIKSMIIITLFTVGGSRLFLFLFFETKVVPYHARGYTFIFICQLPFYSLYFIS